MSRKKPSPDARLSTAQAARLFGRGTSHTRKILKAHAVDCIWINDRASWLETGVRAALEALQRKSGNTRGIQNLARHRAVQKAQG